MLFHTPDHGGFFFEDPSGRAAAGRGAILADERIVPVVDVASELEFYDGGRRLEQGTFRLTDVEGVVRDYRFSDLGWIYCQGGGYFGGFDDGLGQGVYRGDDHIEGEVWDVSHPTTVVDLDGRERRVRARLGRELRAPRARWRDRPGALRVRPHRATP